MFKYLILLMAAMAAVVSAQPKGCFKLYTRGLAKNFGTLVFTGIQNRTEVQDYNNPMWYNLTTAKAATATPDGRFTGLMSMANGVGTFGFEFFKTKSWMSIFFGRGVNGIVPDLILGGTGCYAGIVGTAKRTTIAGVTPPLFQWDFCVQAPKACQQGKA